MARRNQNATVAAETVLAAETVVGPDAVAAAEKRYDTALAASGAAADALRTAKTGLRLIDPITDADALAAPTPRMIIAADGMAGTVTPVAATKYNKKSVRVTGDNGRTYTLYHDGGVITHVWDDLDYKAERLKLYPMTAQDVIAHVAAAEAANETAAAELAAAETALAIARLERDADWTGRNLDAVAITPVGEGYTIAMQTRGGAALAAIITHENGVYVATYTVGGAATQTLAAQGYGLPTATILAALAYDLANA